jgi:hypothetical protein
VVRDYLAPLARMPRLRTPPAGGILPFAPDKVHLTVSPELAVGNRELGYSLSSDGRRAFHPRGVVTATLAKVDWRGRLVRIVGSVRRRVTTISSDTSPHADFEIDAGEGVYRLTVSFRSLAGRKLGSFASYSRVVKPTSVGRLGLYSTSVHPGETVSAASKTWELRPRSTESPMRSNASTAPPGR